MDTEGRQERYREADRWPIEESLAAMLEAQFAALAALRQALPALGAAVEAAAGRLGDGPGRLVYAGAGASGRLAVQDGVELQPTFNWPRSRLVYLIAGGDEALTRSIEGAEDDKAAAVKAFEEAIVGPDDVVLGVAASGTTAFTRTVIAEARLRGALTIGIANNRDGPLLAEAAHPILLDTGAEFLAGSTRMAAGTAQKIALNLFSTQCMIALGRIYDGLMVNLVATNKKLEARAKRIVQVITGCDDRDAASALDRTLGDVRLAVLVIDGLSLDEARVRLDAAKGSLRLARKAGFHG